jgi:hypothetical protein
MYPILQSIIAQAQQAAPAIDGGDLGAATGAVAIGYLLLKRADKLLDAWLEKRKGSDEEDQKLLERISENQRVTAETLREVLRELAELRRESEKAHAVLMARGIQ